MNVQHAVGDVPQKLLICTPKPKAAVSSAGGGTPANTTAAAVETVSLLAPKDVARMLGISVKVLEKWRSKSQGPAVMRLTSKTLRYHLADVETYIFSNRGA